MKNNKRINIQTISLISSIKNIFDLDVFKEREKYQKEFKDK